MRIQCTYRTLDPARLSGCTPAPISKEEFYELKGEVHASSLYCWLIEFQGKLVAFFTTNHAEATFSHSSITDFKSKISEISGKFQEQKKRIACVHVISRKYREHYNDDLICSIIEDGSPLKLGAKKKSSWLSNFNFLLPGRGADSGIEIDLQDEVEEYCRMLSDQEFISNLDSYVDDQPLVNPATRSALESANAHISSTLSKIFVDFVQVVLKEQRKTMRAGVIAECDQRREEAARHSARMFTREVNALSTSESNAAL
jgi:hypothetical protein